MGIGKEKVKYEGRGAFAEIGKVDLGWARNFARRLLGGNGELTKKHTE